MNALRVLIAEDHEDLRAIVVAMLSSEFQVVGAVGDGEQLVQAAVFLKPDVIITDINMPWKDGLAAKKELQSHGLDFPFIFITMMELEGFTIEGTSVGYVHKNDLFNELKVAVHTVLLGNTYISRSFRK